MFANNRVSKAEEPIERRMFSRLKVYLPAKFKTALLASRAQAYCMDISAGGAGIITDEPVMPNSALELWVNLPNSDMPFYTKGKIVWAREERNNLYRAGVSWLEPNLLMLKNLTKED